MPRTSELTSQQNKENKDAMSKLLKGNLIGTKKAQNDQIDSTA